jgi:capsular exopolysaccharide synthesis family protein
VILTAVVVGTTCSIAVVSQMTPKYTATAQLAITPPQKRIVETQALTAEQRPDQETVLTEIQVIGSKRLGAKVVEGLELEKRPEFNPTLKPLPWWRRTGWITELTEKWLSPFTGAESAPAREEEAVRRELVANQVIDAYRKNLSVSAVDRSRVVEIGFTSEDRALAQKVVNTLVDLYAVEQRRAKLAANNRTTVWLDQRLLGLRTRVEQSERAVEDFRAESGLSQGLNGPVAAQKLSELSTQLVLVRARRAEVEAGLRTVRSVLESNKDAGALPAALASPVIQSLRQQETELLRKQAELSQQYGRRHPRMLSLTAEVENVRLKIQREIGRVIQGLRNEVSMVQSRERALDESIGRTEKQIAALNNFQIRLRALEREATATRAVYQNFLSRFTELSEQDGLQTADVQVVSYALLPTSPSSPLPKPLLLAMGFLGSLALGLGIAAVLDCFKRGFRSQEEIERNLSVPALGMVPSVSKSQKQLHDQVLSHSSSAYTEAIRSLYINLRLADDCASSKVVLVSSATPGEGKTSTSIGLSRLAAKSGKRVILVDCDFRRPRIHKALGVAGRPGLTDVLSGALPLENALYKDEASGGHILFAGGRSADALDLINSEVLSRLFSRLRNIADIVIVDSAPLAAVGDTLALSRMADKVVLTIRWAHTRRETVSFAVRQLVNAGAPVSGIVLSRVDVKKHARYGYGDSGYYHGDNKLYYAR